MIKRIATAVVLIPLVLLLVLKAPLYVLSMVAGGVALLAIAEFLKLVTHYAIQPLAQATYGFVALFFVFVVLASTNRTPLVETTAILYGIALAATLAPFVFLTLVMRRSNLATGYPAAAASTFAFGYIAIPMALLVSIRQQPAGAIWTIFTLLAVWAGSVLFQVAIDIETLRPFGYLFYPNWTMAIELFVLVPLAALLAIEACVIVSSHVTDIRSAQQYASVIFLPLIVVYVASEIVGLTTVTLLYIAGVFALVVVVLYSISIRTFHREEILTRWK